MMASLGTLGKSEILKRSGNRETHNFGTLGFLKERRAFNLGDGKFSGIPKFEMMASLGTLGKSEI